MELYVILALICMILFGVNAILYKIAPGIDSVSLALVSFAVSAVSVLLYWAIFVSEKQMSLKGAAIGIIAGVISAAALITFVAALQLGKAGIVNTIRALSAGVTVLLALLFLSEKFTLVKGIGIVLGLIAVILLSI